jgi:hypothetical protein
LTFDVPIGEFACVRRSRSNTPLQALTTLNETVFLEAARGLADRTLREGGKTDAERVAYAFRCCVARAPTAEEQQELLGLLRRQRGRIDRGELDAAAIVQAGKKSAVGKEELARRASFTLVGRVLLNLDETITKE